MAPRKTPVSKFRPIVENPFFHVAFSAGDVFGVAPSGGSNKVFCDTGAEYRAQLDQTIAVAGEVVAANAQKYPGIPSVIGVRMRPEAIAKSHRPMNLVAAAQMRVIGHGAIDEMLLEATPTEIASLREAVTSRDNKVIRANLSAVSEFFAWGVHAKLPRELRAVQRKKALSGLRVTGRLWITLFRFESKSVQMAAISVIDSLLVNGQATGRVLSQVAGPPVYIVDAGNLLSDETIESLLSFPGVRSIAPEPQAGVTPSGAVEFSLADSTFQSDPAPDAPIVAVFDTGVHPAASSLAPWVASTETFITAVETNYEHGTMVASLVADARGLNGKHASFPSTGCRVHDVCALELSGAHIGDLILRLRQAIANRPDIRVWNLSLGGSVGVGDEGFSEFAKELDSLSDRYGVLFVVAAGNYTEEPRRGWPCCDSLSDRISSPADSIRALTVGAITHVATTTSYVGVGDPANYSRRGPGPMFTPKPDLVHVGGGLELPWNAEQVGIAVLTPSNDILRNAGTSFAAPIIAAMAAQTWHALGTGHRAHGLVPSATLVKALMIHSAELASPMRTPLDRRYFGAGVPIDPMAALYDGPDSFTMVFDADLTTGTKWRKTPYPIPASLLVDGKLRCEVIVTALYAPPVDGSAGAEYVRANVNVGFGVLEPDEDGVLQFKGKVPMKGEDGSDGFEKAQIEHGGKWSPVKVHRKLFYGVAGTSWALQATMIRRANELVAIDPLRTIIIVTLRSIDGHDDIYNEGARALVSANWVTQAIPARVPINVGVG